MIQKEIIIKHVYRALYVQLVLTSFSMPLLMAWGLPLSLMGVLGNLIFAPFLFVFLLLSSFLFMGAVIGLPLAPFAYVVEHCYFFWRWCTSWVSSHALVELSYPGAGMTVALCLVALVLLHRKGPGVPQRCLEFGVFLLLSCVTMVGISYATKQTLIIPSERLPHLAFIRVGQAVVAIDRGTNVRPQSLTQYTKDLLMRTVRQHAGSTAVRMIIFLKPTAVICKLAQFLLAEQKRCTLIVPACPGHVPPSIKAALEDLKQWAAHHDHALIFVQRTMMLVNRQNVKLEVRVTGTLARTSRFSHPLVELHGYAGSWQGALVPALTRREWTVLTRSDSAP